jgi:hypothetical protein
VKRAAFVIILLAIGGVVWRYRSKLHVDIPSGSVSDIRDAVVEGASSAAHAAKDAAKKAKEVLPGVAS